MAKSKTEELKEFLKEACNLEIKIYATEKIINTLIKKREHQEALMNIESNDFRSWWNNSQEYKNIPTIDNNSSTEEIKRDIHDYIKQETIDKTDFDYRFRNLVYAFILFVPAFFCAAVFFVAGERLKDEVLQTFMSTGIPNKLAVVLEIGIIILPIFFFFKNLVKHFSIKSANKKYRKAEKKMRKDIENDKQLKQSKEQLRKEQLNEQNILAEKVKKETFDKMLPVFSQNNNVITKEINDQKDILNSAKNELSELYSKNIVHEKYRGLVPICSLYEYLDTGRCFDLIGPEGAYNLYENELRQNLIIFELDSINQNLDTIKNNQFYLFNSVKTINHNIFELSNELTTALDIVNESVGSVHGYPERGKVSQAVKWASNRTPVYN